MLNAPSRNLAQICRIPDVSSRSRSCSRAENRYGQTSLLKIPFCDARPVDNKKDSGRSRGLLWNAIRSVLDAHTDQIHRRPDDQRGLHYRNGGRPYRFTIALGFCLLRQVPHLSVLDGPFQWCLSTCKKWRRRRLESYRALFAMRFWSSYGPLTRPSSRKLKVIILFESPWQQRLLFTMGVTTTPVQTALSLPMIRKMKERGIGGS